MSTKKKILTPEEAHLIGRFPKEGEYVVILPKGGCAPYNPIHIDYSVRINYETNEKS